ncbi:MAG: hypothetical protein KF687_03885 [Cyclobacteriaceae bacterium]|nr:hypothetical protein [Cyclobacteriaceae bacterium]
MRKLLIITLCISVNAVAQTTLKDDWQRKLSLFYKNKPAVKLHLLFNQPAYAPGDTAYFRATFLMAADHTPIKGNQIITLNVIDNSGIVQLSQEFRMNNGWSGNQLYVPLDFRPGNYRVVAFNDWMLNFDSPLVFEADFTILGPEKNSSQKVYNLLSAFPEGGKLVAGLRSKIVVTAPPLTAVKVSNSREATLNEFITDERGYGYFYLQPEINETYTVSTRDSKVAIQSVDEGVVLMFSPSITMQAQHRLVLQGAGETLRRKELVIVITQHDKIYYSALFKFNEREFVAVNINPAVLPEGVCFLSVNTTEGEVLASRLFNNAMRTSVQPVLYLPKKDFNVREEVVVDLTVTDADQKPVLARISASVFRSDLFSDPSGFTSITEQLMLKSNSCCNHSINTSQLATTSTLDTHLITQKWPWYTWTEVLRQPIKSFYDFRDYQSLSGRLVDKQTGEPLKISAGITFYFSGVGKIFRTLTNDSGEFDAHFLFDYYGNESVYYFIDFERDFRKIESARIEIVPASLRHASRTSSSADDISRYGAYSKRRNEFVQIYKFFDDQQKLLTKEAQNPNRVMEQFIGRADTETVLDDYTLFPTMKETLTEVVPFLRNIKMKGKEAVNLYLPENPQQISAPPMFMIDGVITDSYEYFLSLNPADVYKIKLVQSVQKLNKLGVLGLNGFVLVETKIQHNSKKLLVDNTYLAVNGLTKALEFPAQLAAWQRNNERSPRPKPTLLWKPTELLDANGKVSFRFSTADDTGQYIIRIEGLTADGIPFVIEENFKVTFSN